MTTPHFGIPELAAAQTTKYQTVNDALGYLDSILSPVVIQADLTTPPGSPSAGDAYIPAAPATGAWAGHENKIAAYIGSIWVFFAAATGWIVYDQNTKLLLEYTGSAWVDSYGGNRAKFSASQAASDQSITAGGWATVALATENFDTHNAYNSSTYQFTAPVAGYYHLSVKATYDLDTTPPVSFKIGFSINGTDPTSDNAVSLGDSLSPYDSLSISTLLSLTAADTVELMVYFGTNDGNLLASGAAMTGEYIP